LERFAAGQISVLLNKNILATGYDCKSITDVVLATPVRSAVLWEQIVGRVSRGPAVGGTDVGVVWEIDDHRRMHGELLSYARYLGELWA
jgi:superfamily II DNA or RNA helicase